ncbi:hypothetical protein MNBD_GAMMA12-2873 [hydrothermal vent metagenome]|uniref:Uncharacterized protein n=1 Tax=hydrothermal vent metagenome TaxID=652676 RepID=A0A3B0YQC9_9ZZZZ
MLLESRGIPILVSNEATARILCEASPVSQYGVWAVLNFQYKDAVILLDDDSYEVSNTIEMEDYHAYYCAEKGSSLDIMQATVMGWLVVLCFFWLC